MAAVAEGQEDLWISFFETFFLLLAVLPLLFYSSEDERQLLWWQWKVTVVRQCCTPFIPIGHCRDNTKSDYYYPWVELTPSGELCLQYLSCILPWRLRALQL